MTLRFYYRTFLVMFGRMECPVTLLHGLIGSVLSRPLSIGLAANHPNICHRERLLRSPKADTQLIRQFVDFRTYKQFRRVDT